MIQIPLRLKYRLANVWGKRCGFGTDDQNRKRHKVPGPKTYDREAHVLHMGPTGKTRMVHR